ncbi:hypothetical protein [Listeria costaricensis]|uniref:hypothetical protein n=1 Tax=Listeria costaricensis TaxID=2026604 RepID=UPI000C07D9AA|nr:hypothetical protein [Listeria costaricensis]
MPVEYGMINEEGKQKIVKFTARNNFELVDGLWKKSHERFDSYEKLSENKALELITSGTFSTVFYEGRMVDEESFFQDNNSRKFMFILDTNLAIMIREYQKDTSAFEKHYGGMKKIFLSTVNIIKKHKCCIIYQYACEEASRNKTDGSIDQEKYRFMVQCIEKLFDIDVNYNLISKPSKIYGEVTKSKIPLLKDNGLFYEKSIITYIVVLKAYLLKYDKKDIDDKTKVKIFLNFCEEELRVFSPISMSFGIHYLGNAKSVLKKINRTNGIKGVLDSLYGAAIDLTLPTIASQLSEQTNYEEIPIFVTFDKGLKLIFDSLTIESIGRAPDGSIVPSYSQKIFYISGWKDADIHELCKYGQTLQMSTTRKSKPDTQELFDLGEKLEKELNDLLTRKE